MVKVKVKGLSVWFGSAPALKSINMEIQANEILSIIGPANSGKTTFLRSLNRLNELQPNFRQEGLIEFEKEDTAGMVVEIL
jgi:phosphate transport system ATP-binding protein